MKDRDNVSDVIYKILKNNPEKWISSKEIEEITGFVRQSINWSLRNMKEKGILKMKKVKLDGIPKKVNVVKYDEE